MTTKGRAVLTVRPNVILYDSDQNQTIGFPHSGQNLGVASPFLGVHPQDAQPLAAAGFPHSEQNLPVFPALPQEHVHPAAA